MAPGFSYAQRTHIEFGPDSAGRTARPATPEDCVRMYRKSSAPRRFEERSAK